MSTLARPMPARRIQRSWYVFAVAAAVGMLGLVLYVLSAGTTYPTSSSEPGGPAFLVVSIVEAAIGALVAARRPRNPIGWMILLTGATETLTEAARAYATYALLTAPGALPAGIWAAWFSFWSARPATAILVAAFLLFPTGTLPSPRWRYALGLVAISVIGFAARAFAPGTLGEFGVANPLGIEGLTPAVERGTFGGLPLAAFLVITSVSLVRRLRTSSGGERQQIKWLALSLVTLAVAIIFTIATIVLDIDQRPAVSDLTAALYGAFVFSVPVAMSIAILRYRLYDIDLLINRALVYGGLTALVAGSYAAGSKILERLFVALTGQSSDASTLIMVFVIAVGITPVRGRIQTFVDRRFKDSASLERRLLGFATEVRLVTDILDGRRLVARFLDEAVEGGGARGGAVELDGQPPVISGDWSGTAAMEIPLRVADRSLGRVRLGPKTNRVEYSDLEREQLHRAADVVAEALALGRGQKV